MIALVTDSTAYLTRAEAQSWNVFVAPMTYTVGDSIYHETHVELNGDFERLLTKRNLKTSQPNMAVFMSTFEELASKGYDVICITISSRLSGTYSTASIAARQLEADNIHIVDSRSICGGMRIMIMKAARMIQQGMEAKDIVDRLRDMRDQIGIAFSVDDMGPLRRSGRLGIVRQSVGTILNVKPILKCVDGGVVACGTARGRNDQISQLTSMVPNDAGSIMVHHIANERSAQRLQESLQTRFPHADIPIRTAGPVLGIHLGLGVISAQYITNTN